MAEVDVALWLGEFYGAFICFRLGIHKVEHAFGADRSVEHAVELLAEVGDRLGETLVEGEEGYKCAQGKAEVHV